MHRPAPSIWFEIWGSWTRVKNSIFQAISQKFQFSRQNCPFTAASGQIILFLFKSHLFRTYLLYIIRYNNIPRPVHDPLRPPCDHHDPLPKFWGRDPPNPWIDAAALTRSWKCTQISSLSETGRILNQDIHSFAVVGSWTLFLEQVAKHLKI